MADAPPYNTPRWEATRGRIIGRDGNRCQSCGCGLTTGRYHPRAAVVHHKIPHHNDMELFWCADAGLEAVCKRCHDSTHRRQEAHGYSDHIGDDGFPTDPRHPFNVGALPRRWGYSIPRGLRPSAIPVVLVCGAPASGKSTWVAKHSRRGDTVIDLDELRVKVGGTKRGIDMRTLALAMARRNKILYGLENRVRGTCYLIVTAASRAERDEWCEALGTHTVEVMGTTEAECVRRIRADPERREHASVAVDVVRRWFLQQAKV